MLGLVPSIYDFLRTVTCGAKNVVPRHKAEDGGFVDEGGGNERADLDALP
jgi:hypothetical protein